MGVRIRKIAEIKMTPRRPKYLFAGSDSQQPMKADPLVKAVWLVQDQGGMVPMGTYR